MPVPKRLLRERTEDWKQIKRDNSILSPDDRSCWRNHARLKQNDSHGLLLPSYQQKGDERCVFM